MQDAEGDLPLTGDYVGMGGPDSVPLEAPGAAFEAPPPVAAQGTTCLLDELYLSPSAEQLARFRRIQAKTIK